MRALTYEFLKSVAGHGSIKTFLLLLEACRNSSKICS